ncbi:MAG: DUF2905 domain-containing protein [Cyclobacteriaceae bacterium]
MGKWLIFIGILLILAGIAVHFGMKLNWLGNLPGDISIKSGNTRIYIPIATSIVLSIILSLLIYLFRLFSR